MTGGDGRWKGVEQRTEEAPESNAVHHCDVCVEETSVRMSLERFDSRIDRRAGWSEVVRQIQSLSGWMVS